MYSSQQNAWMDGNQFDKWIYWWHGEVRKVNQCDIILITDSCGRSESAMQLPGLRVEFLPPNCMSKNQSLDLGLISHTKKRYRKLLLHIIVDNTLRWESGEQQFPFTSSKGVWGLRDGHLPHVGDAIDLFNNP